MTRNQIDRARHLLAFVVAGGSGFVVDAAILHLLVYFGLSPLVGRVISIACAMVAGWLINRTWTFPVPGRPTLREFSRYAAVAWLSVSINYAVYASALLLIPGVVPLEALVAGSFVGMFFSYVGYRFVAFAGLSPTTSHQKNSHPKTSPPPLDVPPGIAPGSAAPETE